ncbi:MAG TPA: hypothetical protein VG826_30805 [Pirellulales bacterium]|nr:hypothetical protein [Pirellulales bacterium]
MTIDELQAVLNATPFRPFTIHLADGSRHHVPHRDFWSHSPVGRTVIVYHEDDSFSIFDLLLITELKVANGKAGFKGKRK